jgi:hypothetical protein
MAPPITVDIIIALLRPETYRVEVGNNKATVAVKSQSCSMSTMVSVAEGCSHVPIAEGD